MSAKSDRTISEKQAELGELLAWFESDQFTIEEAIKKFEQAIKLAEEIEAELRDYKNTITVLKERFDHSEA